MTSKRTPQSYPVSLWKWRFLLFSILLLSFANALLAEGSKDFINYPGYRLFYWAEDGQQLKVFARAGEYINVGASHVGITGGFIRIYRPDGTVHSVFDNSGPNAGLGIIHDDIQEKNGPNGGGTTNGQGYIPGVVQVQPGQEGIWTITLEYPSYTGSNFTNLLNNAPWTRLANQPTNRRVVLAWDVTITQGAAGNRGGTTVEGRVFSNEYKSILNRNGVTTSPIFYVLTKDGFLYRVRFNETDPWGFPIFSNNTGIVNSNLIPKYTSLATNEIQRSVNPASWVPGNSYLYEPQAQGFGPIINNKVFFNMPDPNMPRFATVTDIVRNNTYSTWLYQQPTNIHVNFRGFVINAYNDDAKLCRPGSLPTNYGGFFKFEVDREGNAELLLDVNDNGSYMDSVDRVLYKYVYPGLDSIFWDARDGFGHPIPPNSMYQLNFRLSLRGGEIHILMGDIENDPGGVSIDLLTNLPVPNKDRFFYNHTAIGGVASGGGPPNFPLPTNVPYTYSNNFGNEKLLDYWTFVDYVGALNGDIDFEVVDDCYDPVADSDGDGILDDVDLDDDNDGIPDFFEYCHPASGFACLPGGLDPSGDEDRDGIINAFDVDLHACQDLNNDGACDQVPSVYDTDGDNIPDHLDLDSDNDGITDLNEAGHNAPDADGDGRIDGSPADFGMNGLYNPIATDPDDLNATINYTVRDQDQDGVPDNNDLDSDNDGIFDVTEAGLGGLDTNGDGILNDDGTNQDNGLPRGIDPEATGNPIPNPLDSDMDGVPDYRDLDSDNDGIYDVTEQGGYDPDHDGQVGRGPLVTDINGTPTEDADGTPVNSTTVRVDTDNDGIPDCIDLDSDNDGIFDTHEAGVHDPDNDGLAGDGPVTVDSSGVPILDSNGDPIVIIFDPVDTDNDGDPDYKDTDSDDDGIPDSHECNTGWPCVDSDMDGVPDLRDLDSDNDSLPDALECPGGPVCMDDNGNGIEDFREFTCSVFTKPAISGITRDTSLCEGASFVLDAVNSGRSSATVTYTWTGPNAFVFSRSTAPIGPFTLQRNNVVPNQSGSYTLVLTNDDNGCTSDPQSVTVGISPRPRVPEITLSGSNYCEGSTVEFSATTYAGSNIQYNWYFNNGNGPVFLQSTTTHILTLTNVQSSQSGQYSVEVLVNACASGRSNSVRISVFGSPSVVNVSNSTNSANPACEGTSINFSVNNIPGATYAWFGPNGFTSTSQNPVIANATLLNAGNYYVEVTANGCTSTSSTTEVFVNETPAIPTLNISGGIPDLCSGQELRLVATPSDPDFTYQWYVDKGAGQALVQNNNSSEFTISQASASDAGTYFVFAEKDACVSGVSNAISITVNDLPDVSGAGNSTDSMNPACEGTDVNLFVNTTPGATYSWTGPGGFASTDQNPVISGAIISNAGAYVVEVTANGCTGTSNATQVYVNEKPDAPIITVLSGRNLCDGEDLNIAASLASSSNAIYLWYVDKGFGPILVQRGSAPSLLLSNPASTDSGDYWVEVEQDGCTSDRSNVETISVGTLPNFGSVGNSTDANNPACEGESVQFFLSPVPGASYQWSGPNGFSSQDPQPVISNVTLLNAGDYFVEVSVGNCSATSDAIEVFVNEQPQTPVLAANQSELCEGEVLILSVNPSGNPNFRYQWYFDDGNTNILLQTTQTNALVLNNTSPANSGTYRLEIANGSCNSGFSNAQFVRVKPYPQFTAPVNTTSPTDPACEGEPVGFSISAVPNAAYTWYGPSGPFSQVQNPIISSISAAQAGNYYAEITLDGCTATSAVTEVFVDQKPLAPFLNLSANTTCNGGSVTLSVTPNNNPTWRYRWFFDNGNGPVLIRTTQLPTLTLGNVDQSNEGTYWVQTQQTVCISDPSNMEMLEVQVVQANLPTTNSTSASDPACEGESISLEITPLPNATYQWFGPGGFTAQGPNPGISNASLANAGSYYAEVTQNGCTAASAATLVYVNPVPAAPALQITETEPCSGSSIELLASPYNDPSLEYRWYFDDGTGARLFRTTTISRLSIDNLTSANTGEYWVEVIQNGCASAPSDVQLVRVTSLPSSVLVDNSTSSGAAACEGETVFLSASAVPNATYRWTGPNNFSAPVPNPVLNNVSTRMAGFYTVEITLNGCTLSSNFTEVFIKEKPARPTLVANGNSLCEGQELTLLGSPASLPSVVYQWYFDDGNGPVLLRSTSNSQLQLTNLTSANSGNYWLQVDNDGCESAASNQETIQVQTFSTQVVADNSTNAANPVCEGDVINLSVNSVPNAVYTWYGPGNFSSPLQNPVIPGADVTDAGFYYVEVEVNGCTKTSNLTEVFVLPTPDRPQLLATSNQPCPGQDLDLLASVVSGSNLVYNWYVDDGNGPRLLRTTLSPRLSLPNINATNNGTYWVEVENGSCVSARSNQEVITVTNFANLPDPVNSTSAGDPACVGSDVTLSFNFSAPGIQIQWYGPNGFTSQDPNPVIVNAGPEDEGTYYVVVRNGACSQTSNATTVYINQKLGLPTLQLSNTSYCEGSTIMLRANASNVPGVQYIWYFDDGNGAVVLDTTNLPSLEIPFASDAAAGFYSVQTSAGGCLSPVSDEIQITVVNSPVIAAPTNPSSAASPACTGDDIRLTAEWLPGSRYEWYGPGGFLSDRYDFVLQNISLADAGSYYVVVSRNGCSFTSSTAEVYVNERPAQPVLIAPGTACAGSSVTLSSNVSAGSGWTFSWYDALTQQLLATTTVPTLTLNGLTPQDAGNYQLVISNGNCDSEPSNPVTLEVEDVPREIAFVADPVLFTCGMDELILEATPPVMASGAWTTAGGATIVQANQASTLVFDLDSGDNMFIWTLSSGSCPNFSSDTLVVKNQMISIDATDDFITLDAGTTTGSAEWVRNDNFNDPSSLLITIVEGPGKGQVQVNGPLDLVYAAPLDYAGPDEFVYRACDTNCPDICAEATVTLDILPADIPCFIPNTITPNNDGANDFFEIKCLTYLYPENEIQIFNRWGSKVYEATPYRNEWSGTYKGSPVAAGAYFYVLRLTPDAEPISGYITVIR